jgi:ATP-dependent Clp protease ATP-binding subunit ClpA
MMFERFTVEARTVVVHAQEHARRLGHRYVGCEHLLLAAASTDQPASAVLREQGITPERVEEQMFASSGSAAKPACSAIWTETRCPSSGSISMPCAPG